MIKIFLLIITLLLTNCSLNKVVHHHGVHNLEKKQLKLKSNFTNKNDILKLMGPPSTKSTFDKDVYIYIERKTSSTKLTKLGKKTLLVNNVLVLEIDGKGILVSKKFYNKDDMEKVKFAETETTIMYSKRTFIQSFLSTLRQKIDDPLGKKRMKKD
jgi:outer membrane protein assembly factor BamE (lipoprotein component of BamABCDE complex)